MDKVRKVIYWSCISLIVFWFFMPIIRWLTGLDFANSDISIASEQFFFYGIPTAIILTLIKTIKRSQSFVKILTNVVITVIIALLFIGFQFFALFANMCAWYTTDILFTHKTDTNIEIVNRDYGCGAWDSGTPISKTFKISKYSDYLIKSSEVDTSQIDKSKWIKVASE